MNDEKKAIYVNFSVFCIGVVIYLILIKNYILIIFFGILFIYNIICFIKEFRNLEE